MKLNGMRLFLSILCLFWIFGCTSESLEEDATTPQVNVVKITTTTGMIGDLVSNLVGDKAVVTSLIGSGVDPHLYKPTRSDIARMVNSSLVVTNGLLLEGKMSHAFERLKGNGIKVVELGEVLPSDILLEPPGFQGHFDPHIWMDPTIWRQTIPYLTEALIELLPGETTTIRQRAAQYDRKLTELDLYARRVLTSVPTESRILVTAHDAFQYFGKRYGYTVLGIQGISTESEAGIRHIENLVDTLVAQKLKAVFIESTVPGRNVQALLEGTHARGHEVVIGGELYSDAMGITGTYEGTYIGMIDHNVSTIAKALGGSVPKEGLKGQDFTKVDEPV